MNKWFFLVQSNLKKIKKMNFLKKTNKNTLHKMKKKIITKLKLQKKKDQQWNIGTIIGYLNTNLSKQNL